jgi:hypothetical protein
MSCPDSDPAAYVQALRSRSTDNSASGRLRVVKAQTLATYHIENKPMNDYGGSAKPQSAETLLLRTVGTNQLNGPCNFCFEPVCGISATFQVYINNVSADTVHYWTIFRDQFLTFTPPLTIPPPPPGFPTTGGNPETGTNYGWLFFIPPVCNATSYNVTWTDNAGTIAADITYLGTSFDGGASTYVFFTIWPLRAWDIASNVLTVTASNKCFSTSAVFFTTQTYY